MERTGLPDERIGLWGVSYGAATSIQTAAARPGLGFVIADASYSSMPDIAAVQADKQIGVWARAFIPGALAVAGWRAGFDPSEASPEEAIRGLEAPVLLVHSTTDAFTPSNQSVAIYAAADPDPDPAHPDALRGPPRRVVLDGARGVHRLRRCVPRGLRPRLREPRRRRRYSMTRFGGRSSPAG